MAVFNSRLILAGLLIVAACVAVGLALAADTKDNAKSARTSFVVPKLFDFGRFKQIFHRAYRSLLDEIVRQKLFMANAFKSFISMVEYKHGLANSYRKINDMSDWTQKEWRKTLMKAENMIRHFSPRRPVTRSYQAKLDDIEAQIVDDVADAESIEIVLKDVVENHQMEPGYKEIADELMPAAQSGGLSRKKRAVKSNKSTANMKTSCKRRKKKSRKITVDDLMKDVSFKELSPKYKNRVPQNNPHYRVPELMSMGADDKLKKAMPTGQASPLGSIGGFGWVKSLVQGAAHMLNQVSDAYYNSDNTDDLDDLDDVEQNNHRKDTVYSSNEDSVELACTSDDHEYLFEPTQVDEQGNPLADKKYIDLRESNCLTQPPGQGKCGSCFIFSALAMYEYSYCRETGELAAFSAQYIIDCGGFVKITGCDGGYVDEIDAFVNVFGFILRNDYPYRARRDMCPYKKGMDIIKTGYIRPQEIGLRVVGVHEWEAALRDGDVIAFHLRAYPDFYNYGGGVDDAPGCETSEGHHSMTVVGSGREDGHEYWLIRNSYGVKWGESGYWKLNKLAKCWGRDGANGYASDVYFGKGHINKRYTGEEVQMHYLKQSKLQPMGQAELVNHNDSPVEFDPNRVVDYS